MAKLAFFPIPYEDELIHSVLARYHIYSGNISDNETNLDLFGKTVKVQCLFGNPHHIKTIFERIPDNYPISYTDMVLNHTAVRLLLRFDRQKAEQFLKTGEYNPHLRRVVRKLRYCPLCILAEMERYGECYWHVHHQVEGMYECQVHKVRLLDSDVTFSGIQRNYILPSSNFPIRYEQASDLEHRISALMYRLLIEPLSFLDIPHMINAELRKREYLAVHLRPQILTKDLKEFLGNDLMDEYFHEKNHNVQCYQSILSGTWSMPIHYALLMAFLDLDNFDTSVSKKVEFFKKQGYVLNRGYVADTLGMKKTALIHMLQKEGDDLSWISNKYGDEYSEKSIFRCSPEEKEKWEHLCDSMHCASMSDFYRYYFLKGLESEGKEKQDA